MIILEGPDGSGKSTLAEALVAEGMILQDRPCTSENAIDGETLANWVDEDIRREGGGADRLYDRYPLFSEIIYGPLLRGTMAEGFGDYDWYFRKLQSLRRLHMPTVIFCLPPLVEVEMNVRKNHDDSTIHLRAVRHNTQAIYQQYVALAAWVKISGFSSGVWDYTHPAADVTLGLYRRLAQNKVRYENR